MSQQEPSKEFIEVDIMIHVFSVSATLVGVCLTVIGIFSISKKMSNIKTYGQEFLALDALIFLAACVLSYTALRARRNGRKYFLEKISEDVFFIALTFMALICGLIVYELI